jgi:hypothetical protein
MSWKSFAAPLAVIAAGMAIVIAALAVSDNASSAPLPQDADYPAQTQTMLAVEAALTATQAAYPGTDQSSTTTATVTATNTDTLTTTPTATLSTPTAAANSNQPTLPGGSPRPTTPRPPEDVPSPETVGPEGPAPEATPVSTMTCAPGERVLITGQGPPRAAFLLYFGQRVVGGGSVSVTGSFSIPLVVGHERPGSYPVTVRVRGSEQVLRELTCEVPAAAPPSTSPLPQ